MATSTVSLTVLTVTGATPFDPRQPEKFGLLNGLDDGVVQTDSTCARTSLDATWPVGFFFNAQRSNVPNLHLFDPGMDPVRAGAFYADQAESYRVSATPVPRASIGCNPYKAPWGMIEDVPDLGEPFSAPLSTYANHYSFIQSANNHSSFVEGDARDLEEVRTINDDAVYRLGLVSTALQGMEEEEVRGRKITFRINLGFRSMSYDWWIWKRTYHRLQGWQQKHATDYVYDHVAKP